VYHYFKWSKSTSTHFKLIATDQGLQVLSINVKGHVRIQRGQGKLFKRSQKCQKLQRIIIMFPYYSWSESLQSDQLNNGERSTPKMVIHQAKHKCYNIVNIGPSRVYHVCYIIYIVSLPFAFLFTSNVGNIILLFQLDHGAVVKKLQWINIWVILLRCFVHHAKLSASTALQQNQTSVVMTGEQSKPYCIKNTLCTRKEKNVISMTVINDNECKHCENVVFLGVE